MTHAISGLALIVVLSVAIIAGASYLTVSDGTSLAVKTGSSTCTDADNGKNIYVKGICKKGLFSYTDSCVSSSTVKEYYCSGNCKSVRIGCPSGYTCSNGACIQSTNVTCTPNWSCTGWSSCNAAYSDVCSNSATGTQTRTCTDLNNCGTTSGKPAESQSCTTTRNTDGTVCTTTNGTSGICQSGTCVAATSTCTNECSPSGTVQCSGTNGYQTCGNFDTDSCLELSSVTTCRSGQTCSGGTCVANTTTSAAWKISTLDTQGWAPKTSTRAINSNTVFTAYSNGLTANNLKFAKSTDGGTTWTITTIVTVNNVIGYPSLYAVNESVIFVSYFSGYPDFDFMLAKSTDGGSTWTTTRVFDGVSVVGTTSIYAVDSQNIFITYSPNDKDLWLAKSTDGGTTWITQLVQGMDNTGFLGRFASVYAVNVNTILIAYDYERTGSSWDEAVYETRFAKSIDGGKTWTITKVDVNNDAAGLTSMDVIGSNNIFIGYRGDRSIGLKFAKSTDGGTTWQIQTLYTTDFFVAISLDAIDTNTIFIAGHDSLLSVQKVDFAKSTDGGGTWTKEVIVSGGNQGDGTSLSAANQNKIFVSFGSYADNSLKMAIYG